MKQQHVRHKSQNKPSRRFQYAPESLRHTAKDTEFRSKMRPLLYALFGV
jgi:hypothetical protein